MTVIPFYQFVLSGGSLFGWYISCGSALCVMKHLLIQFVPIPNIEVNKSGKEET